MFLKAESFTSATSLSTLAKCSQVRGTIRGQALNLKNASTPTGLQSRTCIRNSSLYAGQWSSLVFLCRGIPRPRWWPIQTTTPASCTVDVIARQEAVCEWVTLSKTTGGKSSRPSISIPFISIESVEKEPNREARATCKQVVVSHQPAMATRTYSVPPMVSWVSVMQQKCRATQLQAVLCFCALSSRDVPPLPSLAEH